MERYGIIGFGCAGYQGAKALRDAGYQGEIHVFTDSREAPANPMLTTYVVYGKLEEEGALPFGTLEEAEKELDLKVHIGRVAHLDSAEKSICLEDGEISYFDKVLIASGARALVPGIEGSDGEDVYTMRTMADARRLKERLNKKDVSRAVVVGASMVGIKIVEVLQKEGVYCVLNDFAPHIFPLAALDDTAGAIERRLIERGTGLAFGAGISRIIKTEEGLLAELTNQERYGCDIVILCIGTKANTEILDDGIKTDRGILVDEQMQTSVPGIYAAGDCAEGKNLQTGRQQLIGLWANAFGQGRCAGENMAGRQSSYEGNIIHNITHFMDMDFTSFGDKSLPGTIVKFCNRNQELMIEAVVKDETIQCINLLGDYQNTGIIKHILMKQMRGNGTELDVIQQARLEQQGIDPELIKLLGGNKG